MKRTRKWGFVAQEARRLNGLGLPPKEIAKRLDLDRSTVTRWIASGKLPKQEKQPKRKTTQEQQAPAPREPLSPEAWSAYVRQTFDVETTDDQLVRLGEIALRVSLDERVTPQARMSAAARFQSIVKQLALVATREELTTPAPAAETKKQKPRIVRRGPDPRRALELVS